MKPLRVDDVLSAVVCFCIVWFGLAICIIMTSAAIMAVRHVLK
jgi:hypothetical protein